MTDRIAKQASIGRRLLQIYDDACKSPRDTATIDAMETMSTELANSVSGMAAFYALQAMDARTQVDWSAANAECAAQDDARGEWQSVRGTEQPGCPWPPHHSAILKALLAEVRKDLLVDGFDAAVLQLAVHAWYEGGVAGYDRGQADAREELGRQ